MPTSWCRRANVSSSELQLQLGKEEDAEGDENNNKDTNDAVHPAHVVLAHNVRLLCSLLQVALCLVHVLLKVVQQALQAANTPSMPTSAPCTHTPKPTHRGGGGRGRGVYQLQVCLLPNVCPNALQIAYPHCHLIQNLILLCQTGAVKARPRPLLC